MARIRSIKPDFWSSEQVVECSPTARLMFVGIWNFADDGGVIPNKPLQIKMQIFPGDAFTVDDIKTFLTELIDVGLLGRFVNKNVEYLYVTGWDAHQRIDRPNRKFPGPFADGSVIVPGSFDESSTNDRRAITPGMEGSGMEGSGGEKEGREDSGIGDESPTPPPAVLEIPLVDKSDYAITEQQVEDWRQDFPGIDVLAELRKCRQWNIANSKNRKTRAGILRHVTAWLSKAQDRARPTSSNSGSGDDAKEAARRRLFGDDGALEGQARRVQ